MDGYLERKKQISWPASKGYSRHITTEKGSITYTGMICRNCYMQELLPPETDPVRGKALCKCEKGSGLLS